jgi:signal transduction histidine kinase
VTLDDGKRLDAARASAAARAERLLRVTAAIADAVTEEQVFAAVVDQVAFAVDATTAALWLLKDDGRTVGLARSHGYSAEVVRELDALHLDQIPSVPALDAIRLAEPVWIESQERLLELYPHLGRVVSPAGGYRVAALPLVAEGRVLGTLGLSIENELGPSDDEREFLLLVARYASQAVGRLGLLEAERKSRAAASASARRLEQLYQFAQAAAATDRIDVVHEAALAAIERALGTDRASILVLDSDRMMRFKAWHGLSPEYRAAVDGHSPWAPDAVDPSPVLVPDVAAEPTLAAYGDLFRRERIAALAFVPLVASGRLLGKFMVYYGQTHTFVPHEIELATALANHLASVINRFAMVAKLEDTVRQNERLAGVLAHDLRNPLGAILSTAQLVAKLRQVPDARADRALDRIVSSGHRMSLLIDQLLDFTRARSGGGIDVAPREADLAAIVRQAIDELEVAHPDWVVRYDVRGSTRGSWDVDRLLQVVSNLVANAGQHGTAGAPITVVVDGTEADSVSIAVYNQGAIDERVLPTLFEPFGAKLTGHLPSRGLGLGVFIVRELVRAHGGTVRVETDDARGTTFRVQLPRSPSSARKGQAMSAPNAAPRILVVDDDPDVRDELAQTLRDSGYGVDTATNGSDALALLREGPTLPSLILLDLRMPVMDGRAFLAQRRLEPTLASVPVAVITAESDVDGLSDVRIVLAKPLDASQLMATVQRHAVPEA